MTRSMLDAAGLHDPILDADVWAGYLRSPHSSGGGWPSTYWPRAKAHAKELLPIYVVGPAYNPPAIVASIVGQMAGLGAPKGCTVAIDIEHYDAASAHTAGVWPELERLLPPAGFTPVVYCSKTDGRLFPGRQWLGDWTRHEHQAQGSPGPAAITQWAASPGWGAPAGYDQSTVHDDTLPLWPVDPTPGPSPTPGGRMYSSIAAHPTKGYYIVDDLGHVFAYGGAPYYGGAGSPTENPDDPPGTLITLNGACTGIAATPTGRGYRLLSSVGSVFCFGDAEYSGDPHP